ncbi:hypothetical protein [Pseudomonas viridiflava]|nr:hypothetical protein [Pseudomonas alliivorans]
MKTHELAHIMELATNLLRSLPNAELGQTLNTLQKIVDSAQKQAPEKNHSQTIEISKEIRKKLGMMSAQDIENYLNNDSMFVSTASVQKLAQELGIQTSKRQSRSALINLIVRHQEASQMDAIIRSSKAESEITSEQLSDSVTTNKS